MANIAQLADSAVQVKKNAANHIGWALAARKAVQRSGITFAPDVNRLSEKIVAELSRRGTIKRRSRRANS